MSKSVKMVVGVVAAVAIPFAAPALAATLMASTALPALAGAATALGTAGTSAIIGAGLGAASSAVTGGDVGKGALFGALGGGLGGAARAGSFTGTGQAASQGAQQAATTQQGFNAATSAPGLATDAAAGLAPQGFASGGGAIDATAAGLSSGMAGSGAGATAGELAALGTSPAALAESAQAGLSTGVQTAEPATWGARFKAGLQDSWGKMTSPENISNMALEGGKYVAGSLAAGSGMDSAQEAALRMQRQELKRAQQANEAAYATRRDEALKLINEANYFDPDYMGLQRARDAQLQGARAKQAGLRGLNASTRQAEGRRYDLGTARATGSAYDEGYQTGVTSRNQTRAAGLAALPTGYNVTTPYTAMSAAYADAERQRNQRAEDIGRLFGDFSGKRRSEELGG